MFAGYTEICSVDTVYQQSSVNRFALSPKANVRVLKLV